MSPGKRLTVDLPGRKSVPIIVSVLPDGRTIARTIEELETLTPEEQAALGDLVPELTLPPEGTA